MRASRPAAAVAALTALAVLALAPSAHAQVPVPKPVTPTIEIDLGPADDLFPPGSMTQVPFVVTYTAPVGGRADSMVLEATTDEITGWTFAVDPALAEFDVPPGVDSRVEVAGMLHVTPNVDAPAFEPLRVRFAVRTGGNELAASVAEEVGFDVAADWTPALRIEIADANLPVSFGRGSGSGVVTNAGNAAVTVAVLAENAPGSCSLAPHPTFTLEAGQASPVIMEVSCGLGWDEGVLAVRFTHEAVARPDREGPPVTALWDVVTPKTAEARGPQPRTFESPPVESPAGALVGALVALAGTALGTRGGRARTR